MWELLVAGAVALGAGVIFSTEVQDTTYNSTAHRVVSSSVHDTFSLTDKYAQTLAEANAENNKKPKPPIRFYSDAVLPPTDQFYGQTRITRNGRDSLRPNDNERK